MWRNNRHGRAITSYHCPEVRTLQAWYVVEWKFVVCFLRIHGVLFQCVWYNRLYDSHLVVLPLNNTGEWVGGWGGIGVTLQYTSLHSKFCVTRTVIDKCVSGWPDRRGGLHGKEKLPAFHLRYNMYIKAIICIYTTALLNPLLWLVNNVPRVCVIFNQQDISAF